MKGLCMFGTVRDAKHLVKIFGPKAKVVQIAKAVKDGNETNHMQRLRGYYLHN